MNNGGDFNQSEPDALDWAGTLGKEKNEVEPEDDADNGHITKPWDPALIRVDTRPLSIIQILDMIDQGDLTLQPEFQRRRVWKPEQKSLLIESLLLRIPLPAFYFASDDDGHLQVIDGLQRLSTVYDFVRGGPAGENGFKLKNLEYLGNIVGDKTYEDLKGTVWGRRIDQSSIIANIVDPQTPPPVKLNIFTRLNKQGTPLSQQELRHAMSGNQSRKFLAQLANSEMFHKATGGGLRNSRRMHDIELVLRFCAYHLTNYTQYKDSESLADFLTNTTQVLDSAEVVRDGKLTKLRETFDRSMKNAVDVFGSNGFRKWSGTPVNRPLFEVWSYVLGHLSYDEAKANADKLRTTKQVLLEQQSFVNAISLNTGSKSNVKNRFQSVVDLLAKEGVIIGES